MRRFLFTIPAVLALAACNPTIDTTSDEAMERSVEEVRASLPVDQRKTFDEALSLIALEKIDIASAMAAAFAGGEMPDPKKATDDVKGVLNGKTGEQILAMADSIRAEQEAAKRKQALQEIAELEKEKATAEAAKAELAKFRVISSRYSKERDYFGSLEPVIRLTVKNETAHPVSRAYFRGTIASPGRSVPWLREEFNYSISGGLEPGEEAAWVLAPNQFSEWGTVTVPKDAILTVEVTRLDGADNEELLSSEGFDDDDQARLNALRKEYPR